MPKFKMGKETPKPKEAYTPKKRLPKTEPVAKKRTGRSVEEGTGEVFNRTITVDNESRDILKSLGGGDFSRGVREAARLVAKQGLVKPSKATPQSDADEDLF